MKKKLSKKVKEKRLNSGILGFDKLIEGGFEKNSVNIIIGTSGSGKTIFATQFLMGGIMNNENVLYITFEEKKEEFYNNMSDFEWDLDALEKSGKFTFLEYSPEKVRAMLEEGGGEIERIVIKKNITRMVIDSITSFALLFNDELAKREAALSLFSIIRKWKCACMLTLEDDPIKKEKTDSSGIEFEADSIIRIYSVIQKNKRERLLEIFKMRGTKHSTEIHRIEIKKNGIFIGSTGRLNANELP